MGDILAFSTRDRSPVLGTPVRLGGTPARAPGQILLFTGVRYQRDDAPPKVLLNDVRPDPTSLGGGSKRRKRG